VSDASAGLLAALAALKAEAEATIRAATERGDLQRLRTDFLGRKAGRVTAILHDLPNLDIEARKAVGQAANETKAAIAALLDEAEAGLAARERSADVDLTMPARRGFAGAVHPVTRVVDEICAIFRDIGFSRVTGPEAESERYNFGALNFPPGHPALDMHDTLYLGPGALMRTHTSPVQVRVMEAYAPPIRVTIPGLCYRHDPWDASHAPVFAQVEGLVVDEGVSFVDLKAAIGYFARRFFAPEVKVRFRPSFFPFTEPSAEVDVECQICHGSGCAVCKQTGWSEIMGAGMVDPAVFEACGVDPERYTGYAFGMGPGRIAMQRYGLTDIRMLYDADVRLHAQFVEGR
jgi:phenylalanyl-tRNA synthetase alpha chain